MKTIIKLTIAILFMASITVKAQVPPPPPPAPAPVLGAPLPPPPPRMEDVDHDNNYKISMQSSDSESGERISLTLKNREDEYLASGRFPSRFHSEIRTYIEGEMGTQTLSTGGSDQWVGGAKDDAVYTITLKDKSISISLDKTVASRALAYKIGDLGIGIKEVLSEKDQKAEVERLERDADRLRRDADRMRREAERVREQAQREADRLLREADRAQREADRRNDMEQRAADRALRDADRLAQQADRLKRAADQAGILTAHKGGMDNIVREVLHKTTTKYDASNAQNRNGWTWPAFQQDLILSLEGDEMVGEDNELVFISDTSGIYVNGRKMEQDMERAYRDLFKGHGFNTATSFTFYKLYDHIAVINDNVDLEGFFKALEKKGEITSIKEPVRFEINGDSVKKDGVLLPEGKLKAFNTLLLSYNIIPVPGKLVEIEEKGSFIAGYRPSKHTVMGTWFIN